MYVIGDKITIHGLFITLDINSTGTDIAIPVSLSLTVIGVIILPIVFTVYSVLICTRNSKRISQKNFEFIPHLFITFN